MKSFFLLGFLFSFNILTFAKEALTKCEPEGYEIKVKILTPNKTKVYFGRYLGDKIEFLDTLITNENSEVVFYGKKKLKGGIYFIGYQPLLENLDFLIGEEQNFEIVINDKDQRNIITEFKNSSENDLYNSYKSYISEQSTLIEVLHDKLSTARNEKDSSDLINELKNIDKRIKDKRNDIVKQNNSNFLSKLLLTLKDIELPKELQKPKNRADSLQTMNYLYNHYLDFVDFSDGRLIYTPFFESKLDSYFLEYIDLNADSVIFSLKKILNKAATDKNMTQFILTKVLNGSINHYYKWDESVYIFLFQNYISDYDYEWLTENNRKYYTDQALYYMSITKGKKATEISLPDASDNTISLLNINAKYTILCFWDITCHHCLETLPKLDSTYRKNWEKNGVKIFSVCVSSNELKNEWLNQINKNQLHSWHNVFNSTDLQENASNSVENMPLQSYNVWYYPSFFLLDENKNLMAKKLNYDQIVKLLNNVLKE